jgi:transposase
MEAYPSDLSDDEWAILKPLIPPEKPGGRPRKVDMRAVLNGIFSVLRSGCAWRMLPREYPPRSTVYHYFTQFRDEGGCRADDDHLARTLSRPGRTRADSLGWDQ